MGLLHGLHPIPTDRLRQGNAAAPLAAVGPIQIRIGPCRASDRTRLTGAKGVCLVLPHGPDGTHPGTGQTAVPGFFKLLASNPKRRSRSTASEPPGLPLKALPVSRRCPYHFISDRGASSSRRSAARPRPGPLRRARRRSECGASASYRGSPKAIRKYKPRIVAFRQALERKVTNFACAARCLAPAPSLGGAGPIVTTYKTNTGVKPH